MIKYQLKEIQPQAVYTEGTFNLLRGLASINLEQIKLKKLPSLNK